MSKEKIISEIWKEKRGRQVIDKVYPLGLLITLDDAAHSLNEIACGILECLLNNPDMGIDWAAHWGRTVIQCHSQTGFDFKFTMRKDSFEKLGVMVSTKVIHDPSTFIDESINRGRYTIVLNGQPMLYEGAVLAIERMVDELVWWIYQDLISSGMSLGVETYRTAVSLILERGIEIVCETEDRILQIKQEDWSTPVRIYGKMYKEVKIPTVIGCLVDNGMDYERRCPSGEIVKQAEYDMFPAADVQTEFGPKDLMYVSLTSAKKLHAGHILHFVYAELLRRSLGIQSKLILESNDVGDRLIRTVAKLAEVCKKPLETVIEELSQGGIEAEGLYRAYRERDSVQTDLLSNARHLLGRNRRHLLGKVEKDLVTTLEVLGVAVEVVHDSECQDMFDFLFQPEKSFLCRCGFQVERYLLGDRLSMTTVQKHGIPTAAATRASFLAFLAKRNPESAQTLAVDSDMSIQLGIKLAAIKGVGLRTGFKEGAGISINFEVGSGTKGNLPYGLDLIDHLLANGLKKEELFGLLTFFSLTRSLTARGHKEHPLAKGSVLGQSFYDYADFPSFQRDLVKAIGQYRELQSRILNTLRLLKSPKSREIENQDVQLFLAKAGSMKTGKLIQKVCPPSRPVSLEKHMRLCRELIHRANPDKNGEEIDRAMMSGVLSGQISGHQMSEYLSKEGYEVPSAVCRLKSELHNSFAEDLASRGYNDAQILERTLEYLSGKWVLSFRRLLPFEMVCEILQLAPNVSVAAASAKLQAELLKCIGILGFERGLE